MVLSSTLQVVLSRHQADILAALRHAFDKVINSASEAGTSAELAPYYGQMQYHLGWVDRQFSPTRSNPGKLLRPTLLLLSYEAAGAWGQAEPDLSGNRTAHLRRVLPAAAAVELTHNFSLIHDDIEDGDVERRHRPTVWSIWGVPQAINIGDGMFALSRLTLWGILDEGVESEIAAQLGATLDYACVMLAEGQYLDISFEKCLNISVNMYLDMISRKTAALMRCAAEMGARLGTREQETINRLRSFGWAIGIAFQVRDDLLGVWASTTELGKTPAGDIYRRKKSLPILHALEHASARDKATLEAIYAQETPVTAEQAEEVLTIFARTQTKAYCQSFLSQQCRLAYEALSAVPRNTSPLSRRALIDLETLVAFVEETTKD